MCCEESDRGALFTAISYRVIVLAREIMFTSSSPPDYDHGALAVIRNFHNTANTAP